MYNYDQQENNIQNAHMHGKAKLQLIQQEFDGCVQGFQQRLQEQQELLDLIKSAVPRLPQEQKLPAFKAFIQVLSDEQMRRMGPPNRTVANKPRISKAMKI